MSSLSQSTKPPFPILLREEGDIRLHWKLRNCFWLIAFLVILGIGPAFAESPALPYALTSQNPWLTYSDRYRQYVDASRPQELSTAHVLVLLPQTNGAPYEQGKVYFPGQVCIYADGRFVTYLNDAMIDLNQYQGKFRQSLSFYFPRSYRELTDQPLRLHDGQPLGSSLAPKRIWRDSLLSIGFVLLFGMLLASRDRDFFRILSANSLVRRAEQDANPIGLFEFFGYQSILHLLITALAVAVFTFCFFFGQDASLMQPAPGQGSLTLQTFLGLLFRGLLVLAGLAFYIYLLGLSLFNIKIEGSHVRANLETFTVASLVLAALALGWNFSAVLTWENFISLSQYFILFVFCFKAFYIYKILVSDRGLRKFYSVSYICLTEVLPSIFLIRLLTDR